MRRFLTISLITLSLALSAAGVAHAAPGDACVTNADCGANETCQANGPTGSECVANPSPSSSLNNLPGGAAPITLDTKASDGFGTVMTWIMSLFAWLVGVAALTLDYAVYYTVVNMGNYLHNLTAVGIAWRIMRDVGNIILIFGFLAVGISIIVSSEWYGGGTRFLPKLLIVAVLLNFSLFLSEAVVDTGNLVATQFYTQINGGHQPTSNFLSAVTPSTEGISNKIMGQLGLQTIYTAGRVNPDVYKGGNTWLIGFMGIILFIVLAFVLFSLAFILIARFVFLIYLIIVSPFRVAGFGVPALEGASNKWLSDLLRQTFIAPALFLLLYVALAVITDAQFLTGICSPGSAGGGACTKNWVGFVSGNDYAGFASMMLSFLIAMGLLLYITYKAKDLSAFGASWATKWGGKLSFGTTAWAGRTTVGWGSHRAAKYLRGTAFGRTPLVGTGLVKGLERVATGSFDVRGIKAGGGLKGVDIDAGEAQKGGYRADLKGRIESRTKYASELTGRELKGEEKAQQVVLQSEIKRLQKERTRATSVSEVEAADKAIKEKEANLEKLESVTAAGAQRKYARALNLWTDKDNFFNKYINLAGNTDAAKKIRETAKQGKPDKDFAANMKKLLKEAAEESEGGAETKPVTPSTPLAGSTPAPDKETPPVA